MSKPPDAFVCESPFAGRCSNRVKALAETQLLVAPRTRSPRPMFEVAICDLKGRSLIPRDSATFRPTRDHTATDRVRPSTGDAGTKGTGLDDHGSGNRVQLLRPTEVLLLEARVDSHVVGFRHPNRLGTDPLEQLAVDENGLSLPGDLEKEYDLIEIRNKA